MSQSVLNLGERIVLASRLAAIEHVKQVMQEQADAKIRALPDQADTLDATEDEDTLQALVREKWRSFYRDVHLNQEKAA